MASRKRSTLAASTAVAAGCIAVASGCTHHIDVQPIKVEPIYMTLDVNIKVDRELDQFFDFEHRPAPEATQPAASPTEAPPTVVPSPDLPPSATQAPQGGTP